MNQSNNSVKLTVFSADWCISLLDRFRQLQKSAKNSVKQQLCLEVEKVTNRWICKHTQNKRERENKREKLTTPENHRGNADGDRRR